MARKRYATDELMGPAPQERPGILRTAADRAMSGLAMTGNALDLIPSMARDVIGGATTGNWSKYNPVDQLASPLSSRNRYQTRDILRDNGLVGKKDTWANWAVGTAGDILIDPLLPFNFAGKAVGAAGKLAKSAGVFDDIGRIASIGAKGGIGSVGAREARLTLTPAKIAQFAPEQFSKLKTTAAAQGVDLSKIMDEPLGGLAKNWMTGTVHGTGQVGQGVARGMDWVSDRLRHAQIPGTDLQPIGDTLNLFSRKSGGARNRADLQAAGHLFSEQQAVSAKHGTAIAKIATDLKRMGHTDADADQLRKWIEFPDTAPAQYQPIVQEARDLLDNQPQRAEAIGYGLGDVTEKHGAAGSDALYGPRRATAGLVRSGSGEASSFAPGTPAANARWDWTHGSKGGTVPLKPMGPFTNRFLEANPVATPEQLADALKGKFSNELPDEFLTGEQFNALKDTKKFRDNPTVATVNQLIADATAKKFANKKWNGVLAKVKVGGVEMTPRSTWEHAARDLMGLSPELRESGIWGNHIVTDMAHSGASTEQAIRSRELALDHLAETAQHWKPTGTPGTVPITQVFKDLDLRLGDHQAGAMKSLLKRMDVNMTGLKPKDWAAVARSKLDFAVPADTHRFLAEAAKGFDAPETVNALLKIYDDIGKVTKAFFTSGRPGFHGRNTPSGWANNALHEQFSGQSLLDGLAGAAGREIAGSAQFPGLQAEAARRGIQNLDDKTATEIISQLYYGHDIGGATGTAIPTGPHTGGSLNDILGDIPGQIPPSAGKVLQDFGGGMAGANTSWNPLKWQVQGAFGAKETTIPFIKAGEEVGAFGEHMNRFPPFVELLRQGVDPGEAAKRVREAQVGYQSRYYTKFEQQVMQRLFLFYKYFKGMVPFTLNQLIEKPSGPLSQALKGLSHARSPDDLTPDWVSDTASIPLGQQPDGSQRYFTGLGLSFEDPLQFAKPDLRNFGLEAISRTNPIIKAPLEYMFGQSTFQKGGPHGGRPLEDLDPLLGRTLANVGNITGLRDKKSPVRYPGSELFEHILSNTPLSAPLAIARTATDPRKGNLAKASNILTGLKITDISPAAQDKELRNRVSQIEKEMGGRTFTESYVPKDTKAEMSDKERKQLKQLEALKKLLEARSKTRRATPTK